MAGSSSNRRDEGGLGARPTRADVRDRLDRVVDPELDRSIVELDYVDRIEVDDGDVEVAFTLPTAWCSPAFAWMMATDSRDEVGSLSGVESVTIRLRDHMHGEEITRGVNAGETFESVFPDADGGVREVRAMLDDKARFARQHDAVDACLDAGLAPEQIVGLRRGDVELTDGGAVVAVDGVHVVVARDPVAHYLEKAGDSGHVTAADDRLFLTVDGEPIPLDRFETVHKRTRLAGVNMGGQGAVCDALNESRRAKLDRD
ncbi:MAG: metal-sulfur cluster assembly factor [Haloferacaceae archaeon]